MRKIIPFIFLILAAVTAKAQVSVEAKIDSLEILIGQQANITLQVTMNNGQHLQMPRFAGNILTAGVEIVNVFPADTSSSDGGKITVSQVYRITSFDQKLYYLPPFNVKVDGKQYSSKSLALKVLTVDVDTIHKENFFGPKDVVNNPFSWSDWSLMFWLSVLVVILLSLSYYLYTRYRDNKPIIRHIKIIDRLLPHQKAMKEIERIKAEKAWINEDSKEYYTKLTETLRKYIEERYGFNAMEMTSSEIIDQLMKLNDQKAMDELRELFQTADLVKFAKYNTLINENDMNLVNAIEFINSTKLEVDPSTLVKKPELTEEEKRGKKATMAIKLTITVFVAASAASLIYIIWNAFELLR